jgi:hypothetical protein
MDKNDQPGTNKIRNKPGTGPKNSSKGDSKPGNKRKTERIKPAAIDKRKIENAENEPETVSEVNKPDPDSNRDERPTSEINELKAKRQKPKAISEVNKSDIESPKSEITQMEVHHHPQLDHKPKPFKEYLLESFMIFIAVMMGFIAENIRENIDNNEHVRQLTSQLVQDLKADTTSLNGIYAADKQILKDNDSLFTLLQQPLAKADTKKIQKFAADSHDMWPFHPSGGAIAAIKNELHLKQLSNSKIIGYIAKYEGHIELVHTLQDITLQYQRSFLDPFLRFHFTPANLQAAFNYSAIPNAQMRNLTQEDLTQLAADMVLIRINTNELIRDNLWLKADAINLLQYVKKQYDLDE